MTVTGGVCLLPRIDEADCPAFRAVLVKEGQESMLPPMYSEWLLWLAMRRRDGQSRGRVVRDIPVNTVQFSSYCDRIGMRQPTIVVLDGCIAELVRS